MTLTELRYVVAVARERHFGRAAERCFVSQPTLSVGIRKLEEELGVTLFERGPAEVTLTPVGEAVVEQAQRVLEEASGIERIARAGQDQLSGPLRLGAIFTVGPYLLPGLIPELRARAPRMPLFVEENYTEVLRERLKHGKLDAIIISLPFSEGGIETRPLYDEPFVVVVPASSPLSHRQYVNLDDIRRENLLLLGEGHCFRDQVLSVCPMCDPAMASENSLQRTVEGSSLETLRHMVASGLGITILPCAAAGVDRYSQRLLTIRRFEEPAPRRRIAIAWRRTFPRREAIDAVCQAIMACTLSCVEKLEADAAHETVASAG